MNQNRIKRICIRVSSGICAIVLFVLVWKGLRYLTVDDSNSYTRIMMHELYEQNEIDALFCGASLCYRTFDTTVFDNELGINSFNSGSSSQTIDVTYYLIKDVLNRCNIKHVYLELSPIMAVYYKKGSDRLPSDMTGVYIISDYMKWSPSKVELLLHASDSEQYINGFFVARRYWQTIYDFNNISAIINNKETEAYKEYEYIIHSSEWYKGKGYVESVSRAKEGHFYNSYTNYDIRLINIDDEWFEYLYKIIQICRESGTELTLVCSPLSDYLLAYYEHYDEYHDKIAEIAKEEGLIFWDFSLIKPEYFSVDATNYKDAAHLNMFGAQLFSVLCAKVMSGELIFDDISYRNVAEKLQNETPRVLGIVSSGTDVKIVSSSENRLQYRISFTPATEEREYVIQDFSSNTSFSVPQGEKGIIHIISIGEDSEEKYYDYSI